MTDHYRRVRPGSAKDALDRAKKYAESYTTMKADPDVTTAQLEKQRDLAKAAFRRFAGLVDHPADRESFRQALEDVFYDAEVLYVRKAAVHREEYDLQEKIARLAAIYHFAEPAD